MSVTLLNDYTIALIHNGLETYQCISLVAYKYILIIFWWNLLRRSFEYFKLNLFGIIDLAW